VLFHADAFEFTDPLGDTRSYTNILGVFAPYRRHFYQHLASYYSYHAHTDYDVAFFEVASGEGVSASPETADWTRLMMEPSSETIANGRVIIHSETE
jgi:hypothetical protein